MIRQVQVTKMIPSSSYLDLSRKMIEIGISLGEYQLGVEKFAARRFPSEKNLRIVNTPYVRDSELRIGVADFEWSDLVAYRQIMPCGKADYDSENALLRNALALTANAVIVTADKKLLFHVKKGGAKEGSIHTFGGYVSPKDLDLANPIAGALTRELCESSETALAPTDLISIGPYFGEKGDRPAALWDFGTAAVYGIVRVDKTAEEMTKQVGGETLEGKVFTIDVRDAAKLKELENIHPQTAKVLPFLIDAVRE